MNNEVQLISDGDGLAVVGEPGAVERYMRSKRLWATSRWFDLRRLAPMLAFGSDLAQGASELVANSGRWVKLTEESARLVGEHGLMESKTPGESHLMIGIPGSVKSWLQAEKGAGALVSNPVALSSLAGIMAQTAKQQAMAEIADYLAKIDEKVDEILAKVDATVLKEMRGARAQVRRAMTMREYEGKVTADSWSEVQNAAGKISDVQEYALGELERISERLQEKRRIGGLAEAAEQARPQVRKWLAVLADCFQLQEAFDVIALDRALDDPPEAFEAKRRGLEANRQDRLDSISQATEPLLIRMDAAVNRANARIFWTREKSMALIESGNGLASGVNEFHATLGIDSDPRSWEPRQLAAAAEVGSHAIQGAKDGAPVAGAVLGAVALKVAKKRFSK